MPFVTVLPAIFEQFSKVRHSAGRHLLHVYSAEDANGLRCGCSTSAETTEEAEKDCDRKCIAHYDLAPR
ncbi:hypothetical protein K6664_01420 [Escherichia ruysiae]|uniref:hypothetical protein n=1 Tax=Escherichia TaxID=561 RepID=UPI000CF79916|nr:MULTISPECIES: hypothetical protein [Escherichia]MBS5156741.1 hypothetical protein [Escherichia coli]MBY7189362.1 hypothetical protein [Escherichia ruysiae]MBY7306137.1 hypothetical protein [Escherichia ruysiae]MBY7364435.1 hypothetical protein [Escherichia coli]